MCGLKPFPLFMLTNLKQRACMLSYKATVAVMRDDGGF